jgi:nucleotidyltransferase/DNA polymerase involved in DNA repair
MQAHFGKAGAYYWISRGIDDREVRADRIRKSVGAENTFSNDREWQAGVRQSIPQTGDRYILGSGTASSGGMPNGGGISCHSVGIVVFPLSRPSEHRLAQVVCHCIRRAGGI